MKTLPRFGVRPDKETALSARMKAAGLREEDLVEKFVRSSGSGGQHLNKTATCVYLRHVPTGIEVKVQTHRFQGLNRFLARRLLVEKFEVQVLKRTTPECLRIEKRRKQKHKRRKRAKQKYGHPSGVEPTTF
ncbi:MAG: peptide chain release factor-like protein [Candidatus Omnitrophica bacterium]|nr:peptide chain release factor-like protein [Candidatus Omnitrophota bacterium]MDD5670349.1 peptide chain release factor-like protein [Candidatus Omnitrophota bacterium]